MSSTAFWETDDYWLFGNMDIFRFIDSAGHEKYTENQKQYSKNDSEYQE